MSTHVSTPRQRWTWRLTLAVALGIVMTGVAMQYRTVAGSVAGSTASFRLDRCLPGQAVPVLDSPHIGQDQGADVRYDSVPPTSGPHYPFAATPGIYTSPVAPQSFVHSMEHGHVVIAYSPSLPEPQVRDLQDLTREHDSDVVLTPYPPLEHGLALAAWGRLERLDRVEDTRVVAFVDALAGRYDHRWTRPTCPGG